MEIFKLKVEKFGLIVQGRMYSSISKISDEQFEAEIKEKFNIYITTKKPVYIDKCFVDIKIDVPDDFKFYRNGFQSWSPSFEMNYKQHFDKCLIPVLRNHYLDPKSFREEESSSFTYLNSKGTYLLFLPEKYSEYISFELIDEKILRINIEVGRNVFPILETSKIKLEEQNSPLLANKPLKKVYGWTSWYYYYRNITPDELSKNIKALKNIPIKLDYFQIDDGWQKSIGDWEENLDFKGQLEAIANSVLESGVNPGIWLAPFVVEKKSFLFEKRKNWLIKNPNGEPKPVGFNPLWSGHFFALDSTNPEVLDYLTERIIHLKKTGFKLFKFDFLYSLMVPQPQSKMPRFDQFRKGISTLREAIGEDSTFLGCGAPLVLEPWMYDILRIGPDTKDGWEDALTQLIKFQGRVSAKNSLRNTITRSFLNGKYFLHDPDVVFLKTRKLTKNERDAILITNFLMAHVVFFSDPIYNLANEDFALLLKLRNFEDFVLDNVSSANEICKLEGHIGNDKIAGIINLSNLKVKIGFQTKEALFGSMEQYVEPHSAGVYRV